MLQVGEEQHVAKVSKHLTFVHTYDSIVDPFILVNVDMNRKVVLSSSIMSTDALSQNVALQFT